MNALFQEESNQINQRNFQKRMGPETVRPTLWVNPDSYSSFSFSLAKTWFCAQPSTAPLPACVGESWTLILRLTLTGHSISLAKVWFRDFGVGKEKTLQEQDKSFQIFTGLPSEDRFIFLSKITALGSRSALNEGLAF